LVSHKFVWCVNVHAYIAHVDALNMQSELKSAATSAELRVEPVSEAHWGNSGQQRDHLAKQKKGHSAHQNVRSGMFFFGSKWPPQEVTKNLLEIGTSQTQLQ